MAVKIFGHTVSTPAAVAIAGGSGVAIWFAYKQHKASSASSATDPSAIDPVTGLPYSQDNQIDPLTGQAYLAEAQEYGSVAAAEQAVAGEASTQLSGAADSGLSDLTGTNTGVTTEVASGGYASNAAWAQAVTAGLSAIGYTSTDVAAALGLYLGGLPLSTLADGVSSASIVQAALAEYGPPPVGSFTMIAASPTTTASAGSTSTTPTITTPVVTTPAVTTPVVTTASVITTAPAGFRVVSVTGGDNVNLAWDAVAGATGYTIAYGPASGSLPYRQGAAAGDTSATVAGVGAGSAGSHYFEIQALPGGPWSGAVEASTTATTSTTTTSTAAATTSTAAATIGPAYPTPTNLHQTVYANEASLAANVTPNALCHYQVLKGGASVIDSSATASSSGAFHAEATGLASKTTYTWRVAVDQSSTNAASAWSGQVSFTTT